MMTARLAWGLGALSLLMFAAGSGLYVAAGASQVLRVFTFAIVLGFSIAGALIASRQPRNLIGWIYLCAAFAAGLATLADAYARYWLGGNGGARGPAELAAWFQSLSWIPQVLVPLTFLLLLFPDGLLLGPRWRPLAWCAALGIVATLAAVGLAPGPLDDFPELDNPYAVDSDVVSRVLPRLAAGLLAVGLLGSPIALYLRFRRATPQERQQVKWLVWAGAVAAATFALGVPGAELWGETLSNAAVLASVVGIAAATGVAILRHRLYDIDVVINRTLVYGALTATLAGAYVGCVLLLQLVLSPGSDLAIAVSTLAVAALFRPARVRIQAAVDRRFYRRRYDAERTLEAFAGRLRDEVELDALGGELRAVVTQTVQPAHVSLWLRSRNASWTVAP